MTAIPFILFSEAGRASSPANARAPISTKDAPPPSEAKVTWISPEEFQYLIKHDRKLKPLRTAVNCFVVELEACHLSRGQERLLRRLSASEAAGFRAELSEPLKPIGAETQNASLPLFFIIKGSRAHRHEGQRYHDDRHYYFGWSEKPGKFQIMHSLGYSMLNKKGLFSRRNLSDIVACAATITNPGTAAHSEKAA